MNISLADPDFGTTGNVDLLLGVNVFSHAVLHCRQFGPSRTPSAFKTCFGWVLAGVVHECQQPDQTETCCFSTTTVDNLVKRFWEIEDYNLQQLVLSLDERTVVEHFHSSHNRDHTGKYIVPLSMKTDVTPLGESRFLAVERFKVLEHSLRAKSQFDEFTVAMREYFQMGHAEPVPTSEVKRPFNEVYYLPMHEVKKESSKTSKVCVVLDASIKSWSETSLNNQLLVGPTVHSSLMDVLLQFR